MNTAEHTLDDGPVLGVHQVEQVEHTGTDDDWSALGVAAARIAAGDSATTVLVSSSVPSGNSIQARLQQPNIRSGTVGVVTTAR